MKISSYNVNGIRAAERKGFSQWMERTEPDIVCLQELKALPNQVPDEIRSLPYYQYYHSAEKKGYSGVGLLSKKEPNHVSYGLGIDWIDTEGRYLLAEFETHFVASVYFPSGTSGQERQAMKYLFLDAFFPVAQTYLSQGKPIIFCGDFNIAHTELDIHDPVSNKKTSGFLPEERVWMTKLLDFGFVDAFRFAHPEKSDQYSWWSYRARAKEKNKGWRIDYQVSSPALKDCIKQASIEQELDMSDHAPVSIIYEL